MLKNHIDHVVEEYVLDNIIVDQDRLQDKINSRRGFLTKIFTRIIEENHK